MTGVADVPGQFVPLYGPTSRWQKWVSLVVFIAAIAAYWNTLPAGFLFDDNFAVV